MVSAVRASCGVGADSFVTGFAFIDSFSAGRRGPMTEDSCVSTPFVAGTMAAVHVDNASIGWSPVEWYYYCTKS